MNKITIRQAKEQDIPLIEGILLDNISWVNKLHNPLWDKEEIKWVTLSEKYDISDFYIAFLDDEAVGCMAVVDYDPFFWPNIDKGESLFLHKLAVIEAVRKKGVSDSLIDFFKELGLQKGVLSLHLDTDVKRLKVRSFYEKHGFKLSEERRMGKYSVAFYTYWYEVVIKFVELKDEKTLITQKIMHSLPKWFSPPEDIERKAIITREYPFIAAYLNSVPIGFITLKIHNSYTADVFTIAVLEQYHHHGIGQRLLEAAEKYCTDNGYIYLTIKTLDESAEYEPYSRTRAFYYKMGFRPLEVFKTLWDEENPCLFLVKYIGKER